MGQVAGLSIGGGTPQLVGREPEWARLAAFVEAVPQGARALLIRGEPGIGKTALWRLGVHECERAGFAVLVSRPAEEEMPLGLTGLVDLFERGGLDPGALVADDNPFARGRAVLAALRDLAATRPVVLAIDDLQWLDNGSARALRYALRRLDAEPVGILATFRPERDAADPLTAAATLAPGRTEVLGLGPLGLSSLRRLLARAVEAISGPALRRIHEVSGGNPLYALELVRGLSREGTHPAGLPLPDSLQAAIAHRLPRIGSDLADVLQTVSALGNASVRALHGAMPDTDVEALLEIGERQGLLVVEEDLRVRFSHPLIGSVVYSRMSPIARRALHARLAAAAVDADVRARHLALSTDEPDAGVAELLEQAATRAREREAFDRAAEFAGHALRLTPADDTAAVLRRSVAEIDDLAIAGEMSRALALADKLVATLPPGPERCEALLERAYIEDDDTEAGVALMREALADAGDDRLLRGRICDQIGWALALFVGDLPAGMEFSREAVALAEPAGDGQSWMTFAAERAYLEALGGAPHDDLMREAVALERRVGTSIFWTSPRTLYAETLYWSGDLAAAREQFDGVRAALARTGTKLHHPYSMFDLALVECAAGNLAIARACVDEGIEAARDAEDSWGERLLLYPLALVEAWMGHSEQARANAQRRLAEAQMKRERPGMVRARGVLGLLALSEGDAETAARELTDAAALLERMGYRHPGAYRVLPDAIEALAYVGDLAAADALLARLERDAADVSSPWAHAACDRCRGAILLACGKAEVAAASLQAAADAFERLEHGPDAARAVFLRGRALLRAGQRGHAAEALADARARFAAMGAAIWEARAIEELERVAPGRATGALTPAERRIAALVAQGLRNREIGQALFMSVGTVEAHLTRTYRKLGIRSRSELARRVADGQI